MYCRLVIKSRFLLFLGILIVVIPFLIVNIQSVSGQSTDISQQGATTSPKLYIATTRDDNSFDLDTRQLIHYALDKFGGKCPPEIVIYIHGFNRDRTEAGEEFDRIQKSLILNNYTTDLVGFSWNSNTGANYELAKMNAMANGPELAKFINELKLKCPTTIRLISHSLGAVVVESTLINLDKMQQGLNMNTSFNNSKKIMSVHLLGAAIDNKTVAKNTPFGNAIAHVVDKFYNLYNPEDDGLEINTLYENKIPVGLLGVSLKNATLNYYPLGLVGVSPASENHPSNYYQTNVVNEIIPVSDADGDGNVEECFENTKPVIKEGDNHCGYIGFRQPFMPFLIDDGAMRVVVGNWTNT